MATIRSKAPPYPNERNLMHAEIRGRAGRWKVWMPDQGQMAHTVPSFDADGNLIGMLTVGSPPGEQGPRYIESYGGPFATQEEAIEYARYLGYVEVRIVKTKTKTEALALARKARKEST
jgi:hypothetical protein